MVQSFEMKEESGRRKRMLHAAVRVAEVADKSFGKRKRVFPRVETSVKRESGGAILAKHN
jgi:hypothetical protein